MSTSTTLHRLVSDVVLCEVNPTWSRDTAVLAANSAEVSIGTVLGEITLGSAAAAAKAGNTGTGTCTMDATTPVLQGAKDGVYTVRFTAATTFTVEDPDGNVIGTGVNGTAFADDIKFVTAAGGTAFIAGDGFDITVSPATTEKFAPLSFTARDGSDKPAAIALAPRATSTSDQKIPVGARGLVVDPAELLWPAGATDAQKAAALRHLKARGIVPRATI